MTRHKKKRRNQQAAAAAAAAAKRRDWLVGDLVVAKLRGHRPWPAQIQKPEDYGYEARPHRIFVTFFGTEETCFCTHNKITPFTSAMRKSMAEQLQKINTNPELERAIKEIFAADDELKVSTKSQNKSDDEKSDEEEEQPAEASSKPPRKKAKIATQEVAVTQEPVVHSAGKESTRPTRAGAAAAAAAAAHASKEEKATVGGSSVKNMAAHQVQKLPRKVRIKVSSQSSDSPNHQSAGEVTVAATDKASVSSHSQKSELESPSRSEIDAEKKADATSSPSPKSTAAEEECSKNGDVEMEEATGDTSAADLEISKVSGEHSSAETTKDADVSKKGEDVSKVDEGNSAKMEISSNENREEALDAAKGSDEIMGEALDATKKSDEIMGELLDATKKSDEIMGESLDATKESDEIMGEALDATKGSVAGTKESVVEDSEKDCESTVIKLEADAGSREEIGPVVLKETNEEGKFDEKEQTDNAAKRIEVSGDDRKTAAGVESVTEECELPALEKVEDKVCCNTGASEESKLCGSTVAIEKENVYDSAMVATGVKVCASTVETSVESKDCEPAIDVIEVDDKGGDRSVEVIEEGKVWDSRAEPMHVETACRSLTEVTEEDPAGERNTSISENAEHNCERTATAEKIQISCELSTNDEKEVTKEIPGVEVRDSEGPSLALEKVEDAHPPAIVADEVKNCNSPANVEEVKDCDIPAIPTDELEDNSKQKDACQAEFSANSKQEGKSPENAAPVKDALLASERVVIDTKVEADYESKPSVDTVGKGGGRESAPQVKEEAIELQSTPTEKPVEKDSEITAMSTATEEALEKDQEQEVEKDGGKAGVAMDDTYDGVRLEKEESLSDTVMEGGLESKIAAPATEHEQIPKVEIATAAPAAD